MRVRLDLRYDGTAFHGWAAQSDLRTVAGVLSTGLSLILRDAPSGLVVAGRTDAGVHARGQVAHVELTDEQWAGLPGRSLRDPGDALVNRLSGVLPADVVITRAASVSADFDARFSALWRRYVYRIADSPRTRDPLRRHDVLWRRGPLDVDAMGAGVRALMGEHDFIPFCIPRPGASTIRTMLEARWDRTEAGLLALTVRADAFCHHMVRMIVGASLAVGESRRPVCWLRDLLASGERDTAVTVVPPLGLTLEEVAYPPAAELAAQAERARRFRGNG